MLKGRKADVSKPKWKIKDSYKDSYLPQYDEEVANNIGNTFRDAAWKKISRSIRRKPILCEK